MKSDMEDPQLTLADLETEAHQRLIGTLRAGAAKLKAYEAQARENQRLAHLVISLRTEVAALEGRLAEREPAERERIKRLIETGS